VTNTIAIQAIHHIRLTVTDVARSQEFYTHILGFQVAREIPTGVLLTQGTFLLGLGPAFDPASAPPDDRFSEHGWAWTTSALAWAARATSNRPCNCLTPTGFRMAKSRISGGSTSSPSAIPTISS
jgi:catechol 2,3-dioxygenase-like lactoylglutathione lyase family enzyme